MSRLRSGALSPTREIPVARHQEAARARLRAGEGKSSWALLKTTLGGDLHQAMPDPVMFWAKPNYF